MYYNAFVKIGISLDQLERVDSSLVGFTDTIQVKRAITLLVKMG